LVLALERLIDVLRLANVQGRRSPPGMPGSAEKAWSKTKSPVRPIAPGFFHLNSLFDFIG
jgi:hypothetical protein